MLCGLIQLTSSPTREREQALRSMLRAAKHAKSKVTSKLFPLQVLVLTYMH